MYTFLFCLWKLKIVNLHFVCDVCEFLSTRYLKLEVHISLIIANWYDITNTCFSNEKGREFYINEKQSPVYMYGRLVNLASSALAQVWIRFGTSVRYCSIFEVNLCLIWLLSFCYYRRSSSKSHPIYGWNHIGRHLHGNLVQKEKFKPIRVHKLFVCIWLVL